MSAATTRPAGNALDHQPAFIGPKWDLVERLKYLRASERSYSSMVVDELLEPGPFSAEYQAIYLKAIVAIRAQIKRLDEYHRARLDYLMAWRDAADAAGADLSIFTLPAVEAAA